VCCLAACQPRAQRLLLIDLTLADPAVLEGTAAPWHDAGYTVEYRRFYPHLARQDLSRYQTVVVLGGRGPEAPSDALTLGDLAVLTEWVRGGGVVVFGYDGDGEGFGDRWVVNRWLAALGAGLVIGDYALEDSLAPAGGALEPQPRAVPQPVSSLDNAGFQPFPAGRNHVLLVRSPTQALARTTATAFIRPPREAPEPRRGAAVVAASRVDGGLIVVTSRHALAALGIDLRPTTLPPAVLTEESTRTRAFLGALARWTRRPAEWAAIAPAAGRGPLLLSGAPLPVATHPPPLTPPAGAEVVTIPAPSGPAANEPRMAVPAWIARQGMRAVWSRPTLRELDSLLILLDIGAFNAVATVVPAWALADTVGTRTGWRLVADRLQTTSLRWFPAAALSELRLSLPPPSSKRPPTGPPPRAQPEVDVRGDTVPLPVWCALDSLLWRGALRPTYRALARLGGNRRDVVAGVALDLELPHGGYAGAGFCDATFHAGLETLGMDSAETERLAALPPAVRYDTLLERGLLGRYYDALERLVAERAAALRAELTTTYPDLRFAFRSPQAPDDWFSLGLLRGFSTPDAPVLLWTRERRVDRLLARYRARGIFVLSALGLAPDRLAPSDWPRIRRVAFVEHDGFWLSATGGGAAATLKTDSLGRLIRRFAK
jgi:hypothetical protein